MAGNENDFDNMLEQDGIAVDTMESDLVEPARHAAFEAQPSGAQADREEPAHPISLWLLHGIWLGCADETQDVGGTGGDADKVELGGVGAQAERVDPLAATASTGGGNAVLSLHCEGCLYSHPKPIRGFLLRTLSNGSP